MTRYHYVTIPSADVARLLEHELLHPKDAYTSEDTTLLTLQDVMKKGYRWIRNTDEGYALFELTIPSRYEDLRRAEAASFLRPKPKK